jgi:hypothetical protein
MKAEDINFKLNFMDKNLFHMQAFYQGSDNTSLLYINLNLEFKEIDKDIVLSYGILLQSLEPSVISNRAAGVLQVSDVELALYSKKELVKKLVNKDRVLDKQINNLLDERNL